MADSHINENEQPGVGHHRDGPAVETLTPFARDSWVYDLGYNEMLSQWNDYQNEFGCRNFHEIRDVPLEFNLGDVIMTSPLYQNLKRNSAFFSVREDYYAEDSKLSLNVQSTMLEGFDFALCKLLIQNNTLEDPTLPTFRYLDIPHLLLICTYYQFDGY